MTIEDIAIALESDTITDEQAYLHFIAEEDASADDEALTASLRVVIDEMRDTAEISSETRDKLLGFLS